MITNIRFQANKCTWPFSAYFTKYLIRKDRINLFIYSAGSATIATDSVLSSNT